MKLAFNFIIILCVMISINCGASPADNNKATITAKAPQTKYSEAQIKNNISKCTVILRKAVEEHFIKEDGMEGCNKSIYEMNYAISNKRYRNSQLINYLEKYVDIYSEVYSNKKSFIESYALVKKIKETSKILSVHINNLNKIFLNPSSKAEKDFAYISNRNKDLLDRLVLNAELAINPETGNDEAVKKMDRMAKDAIILGRVINAMLLGDGKLKIQEVKDKQARNELALAKNIYTPIRNNVGALLDIAPDLYKSRYQLSELQNITDNLVRL